MGHIRLKNAAAHRKREGRRWAIIRLRNKRLKRRNHAMLNQFALAAQQGDTEAFHLLRRFRLLRDIWIGLLSGVHIYMLLDRYIQWGGQFHDLAPLYNDHLRHAVETWDPDKSSFYSWFRHGTRPVTRIEDFLVTHGPFERAPNGTGRRIKQRRTGELGPTAARDFCRRCVQKEGLEIDPVIEEWINGATFRELAESEGVSHVAIWKRVRRFQSELGGFYFKDFNWP